MRLTRNLKVTRIGRLVRQTVHCELQCKLFKNAILPVTGDSFPHRDQVSPRPSTTVTSRLAIAPVAIHIALRCGGGM